MYCCGYKWPDFLGLNNCDWSLHLRQSRFQHSSFYSLSIDELDSSSSSSSLNLNSGSTNWFTEIVIGSRELVDVINLSQIHKFEDCGLSLSKFHRREFHLSKVIGRFEVSHTIRSGTPLKIKFLKWIDVHFPKIVRLSSHRIQSHAA